MTNFISITDNQTIVLLGLDVNGITIILLMIEGNIHLDLFSSITWIMWSRENTDYAFVLLLNGRMHFRMVKVYSKQNMSMQTIHHGEHHMKNDIFEDVIHPFCKELPNTFPFKP